MGKFKFPAKTAVAHHYRTVHLRLSLTQKELGKSVKNSQSWLANPNS